MRRTLHSSVRAVRAMNTTTISTNTNTDGVSVGLDQSGQDFRSVMFVLMAGDLTDGTFTAVPQESPNGSTGWTNIPSDRLQGSAVVDADHEVAEVGVIPDPANAPFVRLRVTSTSVTSGGPVSGVALLGEPSSYPIVRS